MKPNIEWGKMAEDETYDLLAEGLKFLNDFRLIQLITNNVDRSVLEDLSDEIVEQLGLEE